MSQHEKFFAWVFCTLTVAIAALCLIVVFCGPHPHEATDPCGPKVLIFHARWCKECPTPAQITQLQKNYPKCEVVDIDIDDHPELKKEYHVTSVPRYFICGKNGCKTTQNWAELHRWLEALK